MQNNMHEETITTEYLRIVRRGNTPLVELSRYQAASVRARLNRMNGPKGGRPPETDRCPCGAMTAERARKRNHKCQASKSEAAVA